MKICPECGKESEQEFITCIHCGAGSLEGLRLKRGPYLLEYLIDEDYYGGVLYTAYNELSCKQIAIVVANHEYDERTDYVHINRATNLRRNPPPGIVKVIDADWAIEEHHGRQLKLVYVVMEVAGNLPQWELDERYCIQVAGRNYSNVSDIGDYVRRDCWLKLLEQLKRYHELGIKCGKLTVRDLYESPFSEEERRKMFDADWDYDVIICRFYQFSQANSTSSMTEDLYYVALSFCEQKSGKTALEYDAYGRQKLAYDFCKTRLILPNWLVYMLKRCLSKNENRQYHNAMEALEDYQTLSYYMGMDSESKICLLAGDLFDDPEQEMPENDSLTDVQKLEQRITALQEEMYALKAVNQNLLRQTSDLMKRIENMEQKAKMKPYICSTFFPLNEDEKAALLKQYKTTNQ